MRIQKYTSCAEVINKAYRDSGIQHQLNQEDLIEWIYECLNFLGTSVFLVPKLKTPQEDDSYSFTNYRIELPCDFHSLRAVSVNGYNILPSTYEFHDYIDPLCTQGNFSGLDIFEDNFGNQYSTVAGPLGVSKLITYEINQNFITFSSKTGSAYIAYWAFPVDKNGLPLVPDETRVLEALTRYIIMKLDYIGWRTGQISKDVYMDSKEESQWYIGSASNYLKTPDEGQMEGLKNQLVRLKPNNQSYQNFFYDLQLNLGHRG